MGVRKGSGALYDQAGKHLGDVRYDVQYSDGDVASDKYPSLHGQVWDRFPSVHTLDTWALAERGDPIVLVDDTSKLAIDMEVFQGAIESGGKATVKHIDGGGRFDYSPSWLDE
ncbi:hypothetical protein [Kordiimonas marina]|uniref:hypothetical protein n=1 Tax=Kordiimonas marina TaxID=2872312 RepID=UPI001FF6A148|nr:hypothetical protein [Kordiimonas marina]MCJ9427454.1 hypothetical protein [Kordiimonas marina]